MSHEWNLDVVRAHHIAMQKKPLSYNDAISLRDEALANDSMNCDIHQVYPDLSHNHHLQE